MQEELRAEICLIAGDKVIKPNDYVTINMKSGLQFDGIIDRIFITKWLNYNRYVINLKCSENGKSITREIYQCRMRSIQVYPTVQLKSR